MKIRCQHDPANGAPEDGKIIALFRQHNQNEYGHIGATIPRTLRRLGLYPPQIAWDFLSLALGVISADTVCLRKKDSADGWTRHIELEVAVSNHEEWNTLTPEMNRFLRFLTTDIWEITFIEGGMLRPSSTRRRRGPRFEGDCICLLSGGVDSLIGAIDLVSLTRKPVLVSQTVLGDARNQRMFANRVGYNLSHMQLNHSITVNPHQRERERERSQRARSLAFLAYGVLACSAIYPASPDTPVDFVIPENGFIALNVPLTPYRVGSLSTRTAHPVFIQQIQNLFDSLQLDINLVNPYQLKTKGEMLKECANQSLLERLVFDTTSCSRYLTYGHKHCGKCVPCLIRRASFSSWDTRDKTNYHYGHLAGYNNQNNSFDDLASVVYACHYVEQVGIDEWVGDSLNQVRFGKETSEYKALIERGVSELRMFLEKTGVI